MTPDADESGAGDAEDPTTRNRLDEEESPYLRQHADNPVNWQPWDERALEAARERDVPIFLSVGYAACHWCHVMAEESFADEEVAEILNENFVPIKVDREERPDLDSVYMSICQQVTGRGGWPLSAWLTPDLEPFYVGTYFPREEKRGMPAFPDLCEQLAETWSDPDERPDVEERARQWTEAIESDLGSVPESSGEAPDESTLSMAADTAVRGADREHGGWGGANGPKFPQPGRIRLLTLAHERAGEGGEGYADVATETLDAMAAGGLFDHVGGGFHRYCTDREWVVPHFEKMLYDNAEIPRAFLAGYRLTGDERYAEVVERTFAFVERELTHPDGGFYSTLDARSEVPGDGPDAGEREEGAFYVWTPEEVEEAVAERFDADASIGGNAPGDADAPIDAETAAALFCDRYGVESVGNFEGSTVLTVAAGTDALADEYDRSVDEVEAILAATREAVFAAREERPRPPRDEKVLAGWNGLLISALAEGAIALAEGEEGVGPGSGGAADADRSDSYAARAVDALEFVREHHWDDDEKRLRRRYKDGDVRIDGYLEDYAFLARGALDCYQATGEVEHLAFALDLARAIEREFWDADDGTLYFTPTSGETLVARPQELTDQSTPSSTGVATQVLLSLSNFVPHDRFESIAGDVLATHGDRIEASPMEHASLVLAADQYDRGALELTLAADEVPAEWRRTLATHDPTTRLLAWRPPTSDELDPWLDRLGLDEAPPIWAERAAEDGAPTAYACRHFACSPPTQDLSEAVEWASEDSPSASGNSS